MLASISGKHPVPQRTIGLSWKYDEELPRVLRGRISEDDYAAFIDATNTKLKRTRASTVSVHGGVCVCVCMCVCVCEASTSPRVRLCERSAQA